MRIVLLVKKQPMNKVPTGEIVVHVLNAQKKENKFLKPR